MNRVISFYKKLLKSLEFSKLKYRFIFFFLIASLIPTLIIGISSYLISKELIIERQIKGVMSTISKLKDEIDGVLSERETIAIKFYIDPSIQRLFSKSGDDPADKFKIMKLLFSNENIKGNHSIFLSDEYGNIYSNVRAVSSSSKSMNYEYNKLLQNSSIDYKWVGLNEIQGEYVLPYVRTIKSLDMKRNLGLVIINLKEATIYNTYRNLLGELDGDIFILDDQGMIISNRNKNYLGKSFSSISKLENIKGIKSSYVEVEMDGKNFLLIELNDNKTNWKYVYLISLERMLEGTGSISQITIVICLLTVLLSFIVGITVASRITIPINRLIAFVNTVDSGKLDLECKIDRKDEIGKLSTFLNKMIKKLKISIEEIYQVQKAKKDAELKALVFQINPHFLYNTLSSIIWLANNGENGKVIEMVDTLSKLFRISINRGKEFITINKEIEHVQSYITIQRIRYKDQFICAIDVDYDILDYFTPKLILQPLVENAIYHGIKNLEEKGVIKIEGKMEEDRIVFNVIDNGDAMTDDKMEALNNFLTGYVKDSNSGIGIANVNNRIKLYFGTNYGLTYKKEGRYTIASITIPIVKNDSEIDLNKGQTP